MLCGGMVRRNSLPTISPCASPKRVEAAPVFSAVVSRREIFTIFSVLELLKLTRSLSSSDSRRNTYEVSSASRCHRVPPRRASCSRRSCSSFCTYANTSCCSGVRPSLVNAFADLPANHQDNPAGCPDRCRRAWRFHLRNKAREFHAASAPDQTRV